MINNSYKRAAGLFYSRDEAEAAVRDLKNAGYDLNNISIVAKNADQIGGRDTTEETGNKAVLNAAVLPFKIKYLFCIFYY